MLSDVPSGYVMQHYDIIEKNWTGLKKVGNKTTTLLLQRKRRAQHTRRGVARCVFVYVCKRKRFQKPLGKEPLPLLPCTPSGRSACRAPSNRDQGERHAIWQKTQAKPAH